MPAPNKRFHASGGVCPLKLLCEFASVYPAGTFVNPRLREAAGTLYAIGAHIGGKLHYKPSKFWEKILIFLLQTFCKWDLLKTVVFKANRLKKFGKLAKNNQKTKFFSKIQSIYFFHRITLHKSEIFAIQFSAIYVQATCPPASHQSRRLRE